MRTRPCFERWQLKEAVSVVRQLLAEVPGPAWVPQKWFVNEAGETQIYPREIEAARRILGIERRWFKGSWWWHITEEQSKPAGTSEIEAEPRAPVASGSGQRET